MNPIYSTSLSGLLAQGERLAVSAKNIANARSVGQGSAPDQTEEAFVPQRVSEVSVADGGGVRTERRPISPASIPSFEPGSPDAGEDGIVNRPNVSLEEEFTIQIQAKRAYEANLAVIKTQDELLGRLLNIKT